MRPRCMGRATLDAVDEPERGPRQVSAPRQEAEPDALQALFAGHFRGLVRLATLLGADDPEDVAAEAFVRLHRSTGRLRDPGAALPYLRSIVVNLSRSRLRHLRVARRGVPGSPDV